MTTETLEKPKSRKPPAKREAGRGRPISQASPSPPADRRARWVVLASGKGGTGKSTISQNLGTMAAAEGLRVALVDMDDQLSLTQWHARRPADLPVLKRFTIRLAEAGRAIAEITADQDIDLVIVDMPPGLDHEAKHVRMMVEKADEVLVPTSQSDTDIRSVTEFMRGLLDLSVPASFVINKAHPTWTSFREAKGLLLAVGALCPVDIRMFRDIELAGKHGYGVNEITRANGVEDMAGVWTYARTALGL